jgi:hypothetical protein
VDWDKIEFHKCIADSDSRAKVLGRILEWYVLEIIIFFGYLFTMIILMIKSRHKKVGGDQSGQFEGYQMSKMANFIISNIDFKKH